MTQRRRPWLAFAIALSLAAHVLVFLWFRQATPAKAPRKLVALEWREHPAVPATLPPKSPAVPATVQRRAATSQTVSAAPVPATASESTWKTEALAPKREVVLPSIGRLALSAPKDLGGTTLRAPASRPSNAQIAAEVQASLQHFFAEENAHHRVERGLVHPYFSELQKALAKSAAHPPAFSGDHSLGKSFVREWFANAQSYGAGGTPGASWTDDGHIVTLVELRQNKQGDFEASFIVASSGSTAFDQHVLSSLHKATRRLRAPLLEEGGLHAAGLRSLWAFEGRIAEEIDPSQANLKAKNLPLLLLAPVGLLTGRVDQLAMGAAGAMGMTKTVYHCEPHLLSVY